MEFDEIAAAVDGVPFMSPELGRRVYDHIRPTRPERALELGTATASRRATSPRRWTNGTRELTTVDHGRAAFTERTALAGCSN
ncbi:MAG TPA: hypothetical protein VLP43_02635 [Solirubrobacteraceae bacterium]|nr:hypothetical protein [Solirubrobacteraceae bacterium]